MKIKTVCSISSVYVANDIDSFESVVHKSIVNFRKWLLSSVNYVVIASLTHSLHFMYGSTLNAKWYCKVF